MLPASALPGLIDSEDLSPAGALSRTLSDSLFPTQDAPSPPLRARTASPGLAPRRTPSPGAGRSALRRQLPPLALPLLSEQDEDAAAATGDDGGWHFHIRANDSPPSIAPANANANANDFFAPFLSRALLGSSPSGGSFTSFSEASPPFGPRQLLASDSTASLVSLTTTRASASPPPPWSTEDCESILQETQSHAVVDVFPGKRVSARPGRSKACNRLLTLMILTFAVVLGYNLYALFTSTMIFSPSGVPKRFHSLLHFQAHSFNDVRQWLSLYKKGARSFKIDPHYISANHSAARHDHPSLRTRAQLVLTHNPPVSEVQYSSLPDIVETLNPNGPLMQLVRADGASLRIQLCFKSAPEPCSAEGQEWINLVDEWYAALSVLRHVEVMLDGFGKPVNCLKDKWRPWKSVWIQNDRLSPPHALVTAQEESDADNSRFVVLNDPEGLVSWERLRTIGYGRFAELDYPYQLWEPDDQGQILRYADLFLSGPKHEAGYSFVVNVDPVMIATFSNALGASNSPFVHARHEGCPLGVVAVKDAQLTAYRSGNQVVYSTGSLQDVPLELATKRAWTRLTPSGILSDNDCAFAQLRLSYMSPSVMWASVLFEGVLPRPFDGARCAGVHLRSPGQGWLALWLGSSSNNSSCFARVEEWSNTSSLVSSRCVDSTEPIADADMTLLSDGSVFITASDRDLNVRAGFLGQPLGRLGVGASPRVAHADQVVAVVAGDSYCPNSQLHNKRSEPLVCDSTPEPMSQVIAYWVASIDQWTDRLSAGLQHQTVTACDEHVMWGAMDVGQCPVVAVGAIGSGQALVSVLHRAADANAERSCGVSAWKEGTIASRFPVFVRLSWSLRDGWKDDVRLLEF